MDAIVFDIGLALRGWHVGIGEIAGQQRVVVAHRRAEQHRLGAVDGEHELREMAGVAVEHAFGTAGASGDVAAAVENCECVAVFQSQGPHFLERFGGGDGIGLLVFARLDGQDFICHRRSFLQAARRHPATTSDSL